MTKISNVRRYYYSMSCEGKVLSMLIYHMDKTSRPIVGIVKLLCKH